MHARLLALAALVVVAAPLSAADVVTFGVMPFGSDAPHTPQAYCEVVQTSPATTSLPARCHGFDLRVRSAHILRLRIEGVGHATAWADQHFPGYKQQIPQSGPLDCRSTADAPSFADLAQGRVNPPAYEMCQFVITTSPLGFTGMVDLHIIADGPGGAVYSLWMERVAATLP